LGNFSDNTLEFFAQYGVRFNPRHGQWLAAGLKQTSQTLEQLTTALKMVPEPWPELEKAKLKLAEEQHTFFKNQSEKWSQQKFSEQPPAARDLHSRAFTCNEGDPKFRTVEKVSYQDGGTERTMDAPAGDVLHQFRADVDAGKLPAVSWLVAPKLFSDHPDAPWYGAWYVAEVMEILTKNPAIWQKTIFILCYDENDGYFDHLVPFVPPDPANPGSGQAPEDLQTELEFVRPAQEDEHKKRFPKSKTHTGPIGLGYRVPMVIASPWSRGGFVCSEVFDHTSILKLLEKWVTHKTGKPLVETNITPWRRAICGDLTSAFRPADDESTPKLPREATQDFLTAIHRARFRPDPAAPHPLTKQQLSNPADFLPRQEPGTRPACPLPYELHVHGAPTADGKSFAITFTAERSFFGEQSAGAPFHVYTPGDYHDSPRGRTWAFAVPAGKTLTHLWPLDHFPNATWHLRVHGPNGFWREFHGNTSDPLPSVQLVPQKDGNLSFEFASQKFVSVRLDDLSYGTAPREIKGDGTFTRAIDLTASHGWYDIRLTTGKTSYARFAGHIETGNPSRTDPLMGKGSV
jgi:phospholipase C